MYHFLSPILDSLAKCQPKNTNKLILLQKKLTLLCDNYRNVFKEIKNIAEISHKIYEILGLVGLWEIASK